MLDLHRADGIDHQTPVGDVSLWDREACLRQAVTVPVGWGKRRSLHEREAVGALPKILSAPATGLRRFEPLRGKVKSGVSSRTAETGLPLKMRAASWRPLARGLEIMAISVMASGAGHYLHWGVISVSLTNLLIIVAMLVVFALALVIPFSSADEDDSGDERVQL